MVVVLIKRNIYKSKFENNSEAWLNITGECYLLWEYLLLLLELLPVNATDHRYTSLEISIPLYHYPDYISAQHVHLPAQWPRICSVMKISHSDIILILFKCKKQQNPRLSYPNASQYLLWSVLVHIIFLRQGVLKVEILWISKPFF